MQDRDPAFWLAFETENGLVAVASTDLEVDDGDDPDVDFVIGVAHAFHEAHPDQKLVFISELTRWLASVGFNWDHLDIGVHEVLENLVAQQHRRQPSRPPQAIAALTR